MTTQFDPCPVRLSSGEQTANEAEIYQQQRMQQFAEFDAYEPDPTQRSNLFEREPFLLEPTSEQTVSIPHNGEIRIEDLTPEDMDLPIDLI